MTLHKHPIWEVVSGCEDLESFQQKILKPLYLKPEIPDDIKADIAIIEKLLIYSYFEYEFIDLALTHAVFTFEKALKIRYRQVNNAPAGNLRFEKLIEWFFDRNYFEIMNKKILDQLRQIRNSKVHDERKTLGGIAFLNKVYLPIDLINDLYEDPLLRFVRKDTMNALQVKLTNSVAEGAIIQIGSKKLIIFKADIVFLNNKLNPEILSLCIWPIFDPKPYQENRHSVPYCFVIDLANLAFEENIIIADDIQKNQSIIISKISNELDKAKYAKWTLEINQLADRDIVFFSMQSPLNDHFYYCLRRLHQMHTKT